MSTTSTTPRPTCAPAVRALLGTLLLGGAILGGPILGGPILGGTGSHPWFGGGERVTAEGTPMPALRAPAVSGTAEVVSGRTAARR
jgi:hypothetical protein